MSISESRSGGSSCRSGGSSYFASESRPRTPSQEGRNSPSPPQGEGYTSFHKGSNARRSSSTGASSSSQNGRPRTFREWFHNLSSFEKGLFTLITAGLIRFWVKFSPPENNTERQGLASNRKASESLSSTVSKVEEIVTEPKTTKEKIWEYAQKSTCAETVGKLNTGISRSYFYVEQLKNSNNDSSIEFSSSPNNLGENEIKVLFKQNESDSFRHEFVWSRAEDNTTCAFSHKVIEDDNPNTYRICDRAYARVNDKYSKDGFCKWRKAAAGSVDFFGINEPFPDFQGNEEEKTSPENNIETQNVFNGPTREKSVSQSVSGSQSVLSVSKSRSISEVSEVSEVEEVVPELETVEERILQFVRECTSKEVSNKITCPKTPRESCEQISSILKRAEKIFSDEKILKNEDEDYIINYDYSLYDYSDLSHSSDRPSLYINFYPKRKNLFEKEFWFANIGEGDMIFQYYIEGKYKSFSNSINVEHNKLGKLGKKQYVTTFLKEKNENGELENKVCSDWTAYEISTPFPEHPIDPTKVN